MAEKSLEEWLHKIDKVHPAEIDLGLDRVLSVAEKSGLLSDCYTFTIAGTNGKGSTVAIIEAGLVASGYRVGVYTSPHLFSFKERFSIDGMAPTDHSLTRAFQEIEETRGDIRLTYFEYATLVALNLFRRADVDVQVLEVGLGGRLDAVNIVDADVSVITNIGIDHTEYLGPNRDSIAREKAGIARRSRPCIVSEKDPPRGLTEALNNLEAIKYQLGERWFLNGGELLTSNHRKITLPKIQGLQEINIAAAFETLSTSSLPILWNDAIEAASKVKLPGRCSRHEWHQRQIILDVAHNLEAVLLLVNYLERYQVQGKVRALFGAMGDKPIHDMLDACSSIVDEWYLVELPHLPRAVSSSFVRKILPKKSVISCGAFQDLWGPLISRTDAGDLIVVFGSFHVVGPAWAEIEEKL